MEENEIVIRKLVPQLCEDWLQFFDHAGFQDHEDWAFCYCLEGHLDRKTQEEWTDAKERRKRAIELIQAGVMQGYLAYLQDKVIGWCNVNDRENYPYLTETFREIGYRTKEAEDMHVKAVFCFLVAPQYRKRGVAQLLLEQACRDAAQDGYACMEAYPFADGKFEFQYHGTIQMYEKNGFEEIANLQYVKVMRKRLN